LASAAETTSVSAAGVLSICGERSASFVGFFTGKVRVAGFGARGRLAMVLRSRQPEAIAGAQLSFGE
jgi:hypothetical protein